MPSKTVWIVGGLVVALGAIAYLSHNKAPAGKDAAGTIVEAKRARSDGTNSFNPAPTASTTEQNASDASKAMAGPDAAKDAAGAAGSADNGLNGGGKTVAHAPEAADARAAAGIGDKGFNKQRGVADAKAASEAMQGGGSQQARGLPNAMMKSGNSAAVSNSADKQ
jgi:hypothetical protein